MTASVQLPTTGTATTSNGAQTPESPPAERIVLEARQVSSGYSDDLAVDNLSFKVCKGERIALVGPNGAGKSTLFKTMVGLLNPRYGQILIHGDSSRRAARYVAYVPQFEEVDWNFPVTVWDVVMMGRARHIGWFRLPMKGGVHHQVVKAALERVDLLRYASQPIGQLSGGQKRRVFIARALAQEADILLLDEPFAGVDAAAQENLIEILNGLQADGVTMVLATHDLTLASRYFDKIMLINKRLIGYGPPSEVFTPNLLADAYGGRLAMWQNDQQVYIVADQHD